MILFPNAKINLGLEVLYKRNDGFHEVNTLMYPVGLCDMLELVKSDSFHFQQSGIDPGANHEENLVVKAYRLMAEKYNLPPVSIHLHKNIPIGAGLGGGSADASDTLKGLNNLFNLAIDDASLENLAAMLGSDCPFFIKNVPAFATGRGEELSPSNLSLASYWLLLVKPDVHVSTADAYAGIQPQVPLLSLNEIINGDLSTWNKQLVNRFEDTVFKKHPLLREIKMRFQSMGADYASMSGSGSTIFGIFRKEPDIPGTFHNMFVWKEQL